MKIYERVINFLSWIGLLALIPVGLTAFGITAPLDFLGKSFGRFGSASFLIIVFYALFLLRILFGQSELYAPLLISMVVSFLLISTAVEIGFMSWFKAQTDRLIYLENHRLVFLVALAVIVIGTLLGRLKKLHWILQVIVLVLLPLAAIVLAQIYGFATLGTPGLHTPPKAIVLPETPSPTP